MNYQYSPIYKYILLIILITSFLNYYTNIIKSDFLLLGVLFVSLFLLSDFILIENHPKLLDEPTSNNIKPEVKQKKELIINEIDLLENFTDSINSDEIDKLSSLEPENELDLETTESNNTE